MFNLDFPRAYGELPVTAVLKEEPEDFYVEEQLGFDPAGVGEHLYLFIEKRDRNTQPVAEELAQAAGISVKDVGYSGLKDRRAVTRQWFSLYLPKQQECHILSGNGFSVLRSARHTQKLRRGDHKANLFSICLKNVEGDPELLESRLQHIKAQGVPNYFGEQRFGHGASNLQQIEGFLKKAKGKQQGFQDRLRVSAMRSWLFNQVLSERINQQNWNTAIEGEAGVEPSGPLWGRGRLAGSGQALTIETAVLGPYQSWCHFLEHCGLQQERRALVLKPEAFDWQHHEDQLQLTFILPPGTYATAVLREIARLAPEEGQGRDIVAPIHEAAELGEAAWQK